MITSIYASILALLYFFLSVQVIRKRLKGQVSLGDGDNPALKRAIRAHANFAEFVPLVLILAALAEIQQAPDWRIHLVCALLTTGRAVHAYGISQVEEVLKFRQAGMFMTFTALISGAVVNLLIAL